jgi:hypothetical protein
MKSAVRTTQDNARRSDSCPERSNLPPRSLIADNFTVAMQRQSHAGRLVLERDRFINLQPHTLAEACPPLYRQRERQHLPCASSARPP